MRPARTGAVLGLAFLAVTATSAGLAPGYTGAHKVGPPRSQGPTAAPAPIQPITTGPIRRSVQVPTSRGTTSAWLCLPEGSAARAGLVLLHGAGRGSRDDDLELADALAARGIAVLVADKDTEGYSFMRRDFDRLADDAAAQARWLRARTEVTEPVGLLGFSEGGWIAPIAADRHGRDVDLVVLVSASVVTPLEQTTYLAADRLPRPLHRWATTMLSGGREFSGYLDTDMRPVLGRINRPIFAVLGTADRSFPLNESIQRLQQAASQPPSVAFVAGAGHRVAPGEWTDILAGWLVHDQPYLGVLGEPPPDSVSAPRPPDAVWWTSPWTHLVAVALLTVGGWGIMRRLQRLRGSPRGADPHAGPAPKQQP